MIGKYATLVLATVALVAATDQPAAQGSADHPVAPQLTWAEVIECYGKPQAALGCLEARMGRAVGALRDSAVTMARSDPDTTPEDASGVGDLVQQIGEFITYGISRFFHGEEDEAAAVNAVNTPTDVDEGELSPPPSLPPPPTSLKSVPDPSYIGFPSFPFACCRFGSVRVFSEIV